MLKFVHDFMAWWHPGPSSTEPSDIAARVRSILNKHADTDLDELRVSLNKYMTGLWHIERWGKFEEFCESDAEFPAKARETFLEDEQDLADISGDMEAFKEFLRQYGY